MVFSFYNYVFTGLYMVLIHESHVFELWSETKFEVTEILAVFIIIIIIIIIICLRYILQRNESRDTIKEEEVSRNQ